MVYIVYNTQRSGNKNDSLIKRKKYISVGKIARNKPVYSRFVAICVKVVIVIFEILPEIATPRHSQFLSYAVVPCTVFAGTATYKKFV